MRTSLFCLILGYVIYLSVHGIFREPNLSEALIMIGLCIFAAGSFFIDRWTKLQKGLYYLENKKLQDVENPEIKESREKLELDKIKLQQFQVNQEYSRREISKINEKQGFNF